MDFSCCLAAGEKMKYIHLLLDINESISFFTTDTVSYEVIIITNEVIIITNDNYCLQTTS